MLPASALTVLPLFHNKLPPAATPTPVLLILRLLPPWKEIRDERSSGVSMPLKDFLLFPRPFTASCIFRSTHVFPITRPVMAIHSIIPFPPPYKTENRRSKTGCINSLKQACYHRYMENRPSTLNRSLGTADNKANTRKQLVSKDSTRSSPFVNVLLPPS